MDKVYEQLVSAAVTCCGSVSCQSQRCLQQHLCYSVSNHHHGLHSEEAANMPLACDPVHLELTRPVFELVPASLLLFCCPCWHLKYAGLTTPNYTSLICLDVAVRAGHWGAQPICCCTFIVCGKPGRGCAADAQHLLAGGRAPGRVLHPQAPAAHYSTGAPRGEACGHAH